MDEKTLWGAAFFVYILIAMPKYFAASGEVGTKLYDEKSTMRFLFAWLVGFATLFILYYIEASALFSFVLSLVFLTLSFLVIKYIIKY